MAASPPEASLPSEVVIDSVVASVDGKPITLHDLENRLQQPRKLSLKEAAADVEVRHILDSAIMERLIEAEAENRKLKVSDAELIAYIEEVARRNQLTAEAFAMAVKAQNRDWETYREQIRIDILRTKLTSQLAQSGLGVTEDEIKTYLEEHPEYSKAGSKLRLRQIFISFQGRSQDEAHKRMNEARAKVEQGASFAKTAAEYSDGPEASEGGLLGVVAEEDLSGAIFDAVFSLKQGQMSQIVAGEDGLRAFWVERRFAAQEEPQQELFNEVKKMLERRKMEERIENFFTNELQRLHAVDKKI